MPRTSSKRRCRRPTRLSLHATAAGPPPVADSGCARSAPGMGVSWRKSVSAAVPPCGLADVSDPPDPNPIRPPMPRLACTVLGSKYCAFPGVLNGGVISTLFECHGNWTAAIALMDRACLPRPALTLTSHLAVDFKSPAMPDVPLTLKSQVLKVTQGPKLGVDRPVVEVTIQRMEGAGRCTRVQSRGTQGARRMARPARRCAWSF